MSTAFHKERFAGKVTPPHWKSDQREKWKLKDTLLVTLAVFVGLLLRLDLLTASNFRVDSDEAIVGLMAKHISEGVAVPVFYYGQHYMGTLEPLIASLFFSLFGFEPHLLKFAPLLFGITLIPLLAAIAFQVAGKRAALLAALLSAIPPSVLVVWSAKARGGFIEIVWLGAVASLFTLWWMQEAGFRWRRLGIIAFVLGFGWWTNNQIVYFYPAIGLVVLWKSFNTTSTFWKGVKRLVGAVAFSTTCWLLGGLPFWLYNVQKDFPSFAQLFREREATLSEHLAGYFENALPILLGAKRYWSVTELFPFAKLVVFFAAGCMLVCSLVYGFKEGGKRLGGVLFLVCLAFTASIVFVLSPYGYLSEAPRYLLPMYVPLLVLLAIGVSYCFEVSRLLGVLTTLLVLGVHISSTYLNGRAIPGEPFVFQGERVSKDHAELIRWLKEHDIHWIQTNYWIGYRLAFETGEDVRFSVFQAPLERRIPSYEKGAQNQHQLLPFLLTPKQAEIVRLGLRKLGYHFQEKELSGYIVLYDLHPPREDLVAVSPAEFQAISSNAQDSLPQAFDNDLHTRWGSGTPQNPGMFIQIDFNHPVRLAGIDYLLSDWKHDFPRDFSISAETTSGGHIRLLSSKGYQALRYLGSFSLQFPPEDVIRITLNQKGADPIFDWSVAELRLLTLPNEKALLPPDEPTASTVAPNL